MKKLISLILSLVLILTCFPVALAKETPKTFSLATVNDIHYYPESLAGDKKEALYTYLTGHSCNYDDLDSILDAALLSLEYEVKHNGVKYIAIAGDLTVNGEYEGHVALAGRLKAFEEKTGAKLLVIPGNHDINNPRASRFINDNKKEAARTTSPAEFYEIYKELGFTDAYHKFSDFEKGDHGSLSYSVKTEDGYRIILADAGKFTPDITETGEAKQETSGTFTPELLQWILDEAGDAKKNGEIPLLITHWNMVGANYFHEYLMQGFVIDDCYMLAETLADAGINYSFGGHEHISDVAIDYSDSGNAMYSVITPTLTQFPFAYRVTDFTKNEKGGLDVTFNQKDCDEYAGVKALSGNGTYPSPYRTTGFYKQYGGADATEYIFGMLKGTLDKYINGIRAEGSIVRYIEKEMELDIEATINTYLAGGISFEGKNILSGKNVMNFLYDLDGQIMEKYIYNKQETYAVIKAALRNMLDTKISGFPCDEFVDEYGFGSESRGGTLGEAVLAVMATMYMGNEDISDNEFLKDIVEFSGTPEFLELLISLIKKFVVRDVVVNNILADISLNLDTLFVDEAASYGQYLQMIFAMLISILDSGFNSADIGAALESVLKILGGLNDVSLKRIIEAVLGTGLIPYGSTIDELIDTVLAMFITEDTKEAATYQAKIVIGSMITDSTKDYDVTYVNNGPVRVEPTKEDMQLPVNVTITPAADCSDAFTISWMTKYSVTGTDITLKDKDGKEITDCEIIRSTKEDVYTAPGFDAGTFGLFPWTHKIINHTVTIKGLEADTEYTYIIGDKAKNFLAEGKVKTAPAEDGSFTFIHLSDTKGFIPSHFEDFSEALTAAASLYKDWSFTAYTGSLTGVASNDDMWSFGIAAAEEIFAGKMTAYASGVTDAEESNNQAKYFPVTHAPAQLSDTGLYYSYNYGDAHFAVINVNNLTSGGILSKEQTAWLNNDLASSESLWNILIMGDTIYPAAEDNSALQTQLMSLMEEYDVDLLLQGSGTAYIRTDYISGNSPVLYDTKTVSVNGRTYEAYCDAKGMVAIVSGSTSGEYEKSTAGGIIYEKVNNTDLPMFSAVTISGSILTVDAYTVNGGRAYRIDSFAIEKDYKVLSGDVDLDGTVTAADARLALRACVDLEVLSVKSETAADADKDNDITAADARLILRAAVGLETL